MAEILISAPSMAPRGGTSSEVPKVPIVNIPTLDTRSPVRQPSLAVNTTGTAVPSVNIPPLDRPSSVPLSARIGNSISQMLTGRSSGRRKSSYKNRTRSFAQENSALVNNLSKEDIESFRRVFRLFDIDKDDMINASELGTALRSLGMTPTDEEITDMVREVDVDGSGDIQFDEFLALMARGSVNTTLEQQVRDAFLAYDYDGDGFINASDFREAVARYGSRKISEAEAEDVINEARNEENKEMQISYDEFLEFMCATAGNSQQ